MQTHRDKDFDDGLLERLTGRAEKMTASRENEITAGREGEEPIRSWRFDNVHVQKMPDDLDGLLRISLGGPGEYTYCVFRGDRERCRRLLIHALRALAHPGGDKP